MFHTTFRRELHHLKLADDYPRHDLIRSQSLRKVRPKSDAVNVVTCPSTPISTVAE